MSTQKNKKYSSTSMDVKSDEVEISEIDFGTMDKLKYDEFKKKFDESKANLCIYKGVQTLVDSIEMYLSGFEFSKKYQKNINLIYIFNETKGILALAVLKKNNEKINQIELKYLCSNRVKYKKDGKSLGIYLLDFIYDKYVITENKILLIQPGTPDLISYYTKWKKPYFPEKLLSKTGNYLIYGNPTDEDIKQIIFDFNTLQTLLEHFNLKETDIPNGTTEERKKFFRKLIKEDIDKSYKGQLHNSLNSIGSFTVEEFKNKFGLINPTGGYKKHFSKKYRKTRRTKYFSKKYRKTRRTKHLKNSF
jgi:hypothetical protein